MFFREKRDLTLEINQKSSRLFEFVKDQDGYFSKKMLCDILGRGRKNIIHIKYYNFHKYRLYCMVYKLNAFVRWAVGCGQSGDSIGEFVEMLICNWSISTYAAQCHMRSIC